MPNRDQLSHAIARLMPYIIRGAHLDFFVTRRISQTQFLVLVAIHAYERCTMGTLATNLHVSLPAASGIVTRLVRSGYVLRAEDPDDRRQVVVRLSPKGEAFIREFQATLSRRWAEVLRELNARELGVMFSVVSKLSQRLSRT